MIAKAANFCFHLLIGSPSMVYVACPEEPEDGSAPVRPTAMIPGLACEPVDYSMVEGLDRSISGILLDGELITRNQDMIGTEAGIDGTHLLEAAQERAGYGQQHQGDGDL